MIDSDALDAYEATLAAARAAKTRLPAQDVTAHLQPAAPAPALTDALREPRPGLHDNASTASSPADDELHRRFKQVVRRWAESSSITLDESWDP